LCCINSDKVIGDQLGPVLPKERKDGYEFTEKKSFNTVSCFARVLVLGDSTDLHLSILLYPSTLTNEKRAYFSE